MLEISDLPTVNATLNTISAILLTVGYVLIRQRKIAAHKKCILAAFAVSVLFLISYCIYHANAGSTNFTQQGWIRPVYFTILISHIILAFAIVPLALRTLYLAWRERFEKHRRIAKITLPIWLYVSVTGVLIYLMLYQMG
ncbi:MAG: DUF420 domain-containing protein [Candidatus Poribacteria bacterium]|nr:DUF420 domain-containing protein [Candidatus Poribacteria bacterium]